MNDKNNIDSGSVGIVKPELIHFDNPLLLSCGRELVLIWFMKLMAP